MSTPGTDCDVTLTHSSVNGGVAVGFMVKRGDKRGPFVVLERERYGVGLWMDLGEAERVAKLTILALPTLRNPDGSAYSLTAGQVRTYIDAFFALTSRFTLTDALGSLTVGWGTLTERRYSDGREYDLELRVL